MKWWDTMWNPYIGCTKCSPACYNCWARREEQGRFRHLNRLIPERWKLGQSLLLQRAREGVDFDDGPVYQGDQVLKRPLTWRKPRTVFVCGRSDLFHSRIPFGDIDRVWAVMAASPKHTFIVCTKRAARMLAYLGADKYAQAGRHGAVLGALDFEVQPEGRGRRDEDFAAWPLPNVILMVTAEDQERVDQRIPDLLQCPAACRAVSIEPMLGPVHLLQYLHNEAVVFRGAAVEPVPPLDWVIVGGESGKDARPMHPGWVRCVRDQCTAAGVPFLFKQWGEYAPAELVSQKTRWDYHRRYGQGPTQCKPELIRYAYADGSFAAAGDGCSIPVYVTMYRVRRKWAGDKLDGKTWRQLPAAMPA